MTPDDIENPGVGRAWLRGYRREDVERLMRELADSLEDATLERARLAGEVEKMQVEATTHRELEAVLRSTLVSAERVVQDMQEQARREADLIVQEAYAQGRRENRQAISERQRLEEDIRKIRALLRSALDGLAAPPEQTETRGDPADVALPDVDEPANDEARGLAG